MISQPVKEPEKRHSPFFGRATPSGCIDCQTMSFVGYYSFVGVLPVEKMPSRGS